MPVAQHGNFIRIQNTFIRIDSIIAIKPKDLVQYDHEDKILSKDFPEIHVETIKCSFAFLFQEFEQRDQALEKLIAIVARLD